MSNGRISNNSNHSAAVMFWGAVIASVFIYAYSVPFTSESPSPLEANCTMAVTDARIYSDNSDDQSSFATIQKLSCVDILQCKDGWCEFRLPKQFGDGATAWVQSKYLSDMWPTAVPRTPLPSSTPSPSPTRVYVDAGYDSPRPQHDYRADVDKYIYLDELYKDYLEDIAADNALDYLSAQAEYSDMIAEEAMYYANEGGCVIKGNISIYGEERIYHVPGDEFYDETEINVEKGEQWFCSEEDAQAAGWRRAYR
jgi:hypothetical protein